MKYITMLTIMLLCAAIFCMPGCSDINYPDNVLDKDPNDMSGGSIVINGGAQFAYLQQVTVTCNVDNAVTMQFSTDATNWSTREAFNKTRVLELPLLYGQQTVYGQFFNSRGDAVMYDDSIFFIERCIASSSAYLGGDVAISDDGTVIAVGSYEGNANAAYVFRKQAIDWDCTVIKPDDISTGDKFGFSVALSGDGIWLFVGAPVKRAVYVYEYTGSWQQQQKITSSTTSFGYDITTDNSGLYLGVVSYEGKTFEIYNRDVSKQYILKHKIYYSIAKSYCVKIKNQSDYAYVFLGLNSNNKGRVEIFKLTSDGMWGFYTITPADNQEYADFGRSISVTSDGNICVIGAPYYDIQADDDKGCFYVYQKNQSGYTLVSQVKNISGTNGDALGMAASILPDGQYIFASMPLADEGGVDRGKVLVYRLNGSNVEYMDSFYPDDRNEKCYFGQALAVSSTGVVAIGAPYAYTHANNDNGGVVYIRRIQ
ncbi:MAG: hypothetical protein QHH74_15980 [Spirochaetota bacterium]|nr:hypothetical protein [Spirochaetota bacterium]